MSDENEGEKKGSSDESRRAPNLPRRRFMTPEERRLLATPRSSEHTQPTPVGREDEPSTEDQAEATVDPVESNEERSHQFLPSEGATSVNDRRLADPAAALSDSARSSRAAEVQRLAFGAALLLLIVGAIWVGHKIDSWRQLIATYRKSPELAATAYKFPGVSSPELVETALDAEKNSQWQEASDRYTEAKEKNLAFHGILFRIGKMNFYRKNAEEADKAFAESIAFGEDLGASNFFRARIAFARHDLTSALRLFEAATNAEPFVSDFFYFWGEALRANHQPNEAIGRFEQAARRSANEQDATVCRFKTRLARLEAGAATKVGDEIASIRRDGPVSIDWLLTEAALEIRQGHPDKAVPLLTEARAGDKPTLFQSCITDVIFTEAAKTYPEIARLVTP